MWNTSTMCGTPNSSVDARMANVKCFGIELLLAHDTTQAKIE